MTAADFSGGMFTKEWKAQTSSSRSRIRVALTWNSKVAASGGVPSSSVLDADLDLWVYDPDGHPGRGVDDVGQQLGVRRVHAVEDRHVHDQGARLQRPVGLLELVRRRVDDALRSVLMG